jgi:hypothetical protein
MSGQCPNHGVFTAEQKQAAVQKLADALALMARGGILLQEGVREELKHAEIYGGLKSLPMDIGILVFHPPSRISRHKLAYTIDWLAKREPSEIAKRVDENINESLSAA